MAGTIGGFGLVVKIGGTAITYLLDGEIPKFKKFIAEATPQNASGGYAVRVATGKRSLEPFKVTLGWDSDEVTHAAVQTAFDAETASAIVIESPGTDETISFSAFIEEIGRATKDEDAYKAEVMITPTGAPTIA